MGVEATRALIKILPNVEQGQIILRVGVVRSVIQIGPRDEFDSPSVVRVRCGLRTRSDEVILLA